ncbi:hypothetical protein [Actinoplanes sp. NPDC049802]|uniref:hypothetical protein n=1 Tax=Actinoplanes sp. NPDC049802 TaxID=3154742 RepID=UPI0033DEDC57
MTTHDTEVLPRPPDLNDELAAVAPRRWWNRTTIALLGVVLLAGGFLGGVQAHERWGSSTTTSPGSPQGAGMPSGGIGGRGPAASRAPSAGGATGTVKLVDGTTLYVETADGETVTVRTSDSTTVKLSQTATLETLTSGLPVTVEGLPDSEGIITATSVTAG